MIGTQLVGTAVIPQVELVESRFVGQSHRVITPSQAYIRFTLKKDEAPVYFRHARDGPGAQVFAVVKRIGHCRHVPEHKDAIKLTRVINLFAKIARGVRMPMQVLPKPCHKRSVTGAELR